MVVTFAAGQSKVGTTSAPFLGIGVGPRSVGMGGGAVAVVTDVSTMLINPGIISRLDGGQTMFAKTNWLVDTNINFAAAVIRINRSGTFGIYLLQVDYGREEITDLYNQNGTGLYYNASDIVTGLAYSQNLTNQFSIGGTIKFISQQIHNVHASTVAADVGLLYKSVNDAYRIGMSISNFGSDMIMDGKDLLRKIDLDSESEGHNETIVAKLKTDAWPLPLFFRVGVSSDLIKSSTMRLTLAADSFIPSDDVETVRLGLETAFMERVFLRGGYSALGNSQSEEGLALGAGVRVYSGGFTVSLDYAIQDFGMFEPVSHWGIVINF
ncbi:MAG: PorV/PorQ family protein [Candidatus Marinimicrobia bacterium]|nr:PorV/PorQ family protein [Candidatus Neomarinimicrobiota bacterium]